MNTKKTAHFLFPFALILILNSCLGMAIDIQMDRGGSGRLTMDYKISRLLGDLGALDGNSSFQTIPVSREDLQRTVNRIPGLRIISYSNRNNALDSLINFVLEFDNPDALLGFLDPISESTAITVNQQSGKFDIIILDDAGFDDDIDAFDLIQNMFTGYDFSINFSAPGNSTLTITDGEGKPLASSSEATTVLSGRKVSFSINMAELYSFKQGLGFSFNW
jgi:hypothetical protein